MSILYLFPVPGYKTTEMKDFEFDCDPENGNKFQKFYTLGPDADGDGIPASLAAQEICTGDTVRDGNLLVPKGYDRQNKAIDWVSMRNNLNVHSFLGPVNTSVGQFKSLGFKGFYFWQLRLNQIKGGGQWGYASGFGYDKPGLIDCDDADPIVPYGALYKDTDKDGYPDTLERFTCYDPYYTSGNNWFSEVDLATGSQGICFGRQQNGPHPRLLIAHLTTPMFSRTAVQIWILLRAA